MLFFSRVVLKKLDGNELRLFRGAEKSLKSACKACADVKFLKFCAANQLLPKFVNFNLYDVSANNADDTIKFKQSLLARETNKRSSDQAEFVKVAVGCVVNLRKMLHNFRFYSCIFLLQRIVKQLLVIFFIGTRIN